MSQYMLWVRTTPLSVSEQLECQDISEIVDNLSEMQPYSTSGGGKVQIVVKVTDNIVGSLLPRLQKLQGGIYERQKTASSRGIGTTGK